VDEVVAVVQVVFVPGSRLSLSKASLPQPPRRIPVVHMHICVILRSDRGFSGVAVVEGVHPVFV